MCKVQAALFEQLEIMQGRMEDFAQTNVPDPNLFSHEKIAAIVTSAVKSATADLFTELAALRAQLTREAVRDISNEVSAETIAEPSTSSGEASRQVVHSQEAQAAPLGSDSIDRYQTPSRAPSEDEPEAKQRVKRRQKREAQAESTEQLAPTGSKETTQVETDGADPVEQTLGFLWILWISLDEFLEMIQESEYACIQFRCWLGNQSAEPSFRAVSVHHIATTLQEEISCVVLDAGTLASSGFWRWQEILAVGLTRDAKVYEIEPDVIRKKGENTICPRDQRTGGLTDVGRAQMSWKSCGDGTSPSLQKLSLIFVHFGSLFGWSRHMGMEYEGRLTENQTWS
eukprot:s2072_g6.t1